EPLAIAPTVGGHRLDLERDREHRGPGLRLADADVGLEAVARHGVRAPRGLVGRVADAVDPLLEEAREVAPGGGLHRGPQVLAPDVSVGVLGEVGVDAVEEDLVEHAYGNVRS